MVHTVISTPVEHVSLIEQYLCQPLGQDMTTNARMARYSGARRTQARDLARAFQMFNPVLEARDLTRAFQMFDPILECRDVAVTN
jgi:hypothetical protein